MKKINIFLLGLIILSTLTACGKDEELSNGTGIAEEEHDGHDHDDHEGHSHEGEENIVELDYAKLDQAIEQVLEEIPSFSVQEEIEKGTEESLSTYFNEDKMEFRLKVESVIGNKEYDKEELKVYSQYYVKENLLAIEMAKKKYNIEVKPSEVASYIEENVKGIVPEEKEQYAKSIGVTLEELDNIFDRDIYIMDVLWSKLTPILMEKYQQGDGESEEEYMERLTNEFYNA